LASAGGLQAADQYRYGDGYADKRGNGNTPIALNFITPHQKWGIHSTYTDNLHMLTLSRGGPIVWLSETDAKKAGIKDNDWIEAFNANGALVARAVVSQRVMEGMVMMYHAQEKSSTCRAARSPARVAVSTTQSRARRSSRRI
jgi:nitrate reductase alpha subunit